MFMVGRQCLREVCLWRLLRGLSGRGMFVGAVCLHAIVSVRGMFVGVFCRCRFDGRGLSVAAYILFFDR